MNSSELPRPLRGIVVPVVTPLLSPNRLDCEGLERVVDRLLRGGVHGLFVLGSTGEGPSLPAAIREQVIARTCRLAEGRVPVLVGVSDTCLEESLRWARLASEHGAAGVVLAPPYYLAASQSELRDYVGRLVEQAPLPVFLYNAPSFTKLSFEPETVRALADLPQVAGLKDSSGDRIYFHRVRYLLQGRDDFSLLVGPEELLADLLLWGGHGGVSGGAHIWPELYTGLYDAATAKDLGRVRRLHDLLMYVNTEIYYVSREPSSVFKAIKCCLSLLGVCGDVMAPPLLPFGAAEREKLKQRMEEMNRRLEQEASVGTAAPAAHSGGPAGGNFQGR